MNQAAILRVIDALKRESDSMEKFRREADELKDKMFYLGQHGGLNYAIALIERELKKV